MIRSNCRIAEDTSSQNGLQLRPTSFSSNRLGSPSGVPFPLTSWSTASRLSKPEDSAELQALFSGGTSSVDERHSKLGGKKNCSTLMVVKMRLRKHMSCSFGLKKIKLKSSVSCSEVESERRKELKLSKQLRIREELGNEEIYDEDANSLSSISAEIHESELLAGAFVSPDIDSCQSEKLVPEKYPIVKSELWSYDVRDTQPNFPSSFNEQVRTCQESPAPIFIEDYRMQPRRSSVDHSTEKSPVSNALTVESLMDASGLEMPPPPLLLPQRLPSIADAVIHRSSWRLSFVSDRRSSMLRALSQEHSPPSTNDAEPFTIDTSTLKARPNQGLRMLSDKLVNHSDGASYLQNPLSCSTDLEAETWERMDSNIVTQSLTSQAQEMQASRQRTSRDIAYFASCPQLSILKIGCRPRRNSYAGECSDIIYSWSSLSSINGKSMTPTQRPHGAPRRSRSARRARRITIHSSLAASETSSFRHRESELHVIKTRFPKSITKRSIVTPAVSRFKEELESTPPNSHGKQSTLLVRQISRMARLAPGRSFTLPVTLGIQDSRYSFSTARPTNSGHTSNPENITVQMSITRGIHQGQVLLGRIVGMWQRSKHLPNHPVKGLSEELDLHKKSCKSGSGLGHISLRIPSLRVRKPRTQRVDVLNPSLIMVDSITPDPVNTQKPLVGNECRTSNMKLEVEAGNERRMPDGGTPPLESSSRHKRSEPDGNMGFLDHGLKQDLAGDNFEQITIQGRNSMEGTKVNERSNGRLLRASRGIRSTLARLSTTKCMVRNTDIHQRGRSVISHNKIQDFGIQKPPIEVVPPVKMEEDVERTLRRRDMTKRGIHLSDGKESLEGLAKEFSSFPVPEVSIADPRFYSDCLLTPRDYDESESSIATASENAAEKTEANDNSAHNTEQLAVENFKYGNDGDSPRYYNSNGIPLRKSTLDFKDELESMERFEMERAIRTAEKVWKQ